jgi:hypothetical protein
MVRDLAFSASNKAQNRVLKQAAALKHDTNTEFRNKFRCMQAEKRGREMESTLVQVTKASTPQIVLDKCRPVLNALAPSSMYLLISLLANVPMEDMLGLLTLAWMPKEEHWWVFDMHWKAPSRSISNLLELLQCKSPQHARVRPPKRTTVATIPPSTEEPMTRNDHVNKPIEVLLQSAYSANKGPRWRRKQLGLMDIDVQNDRFRQCLLSDYVWLKAYLLVTKGQT